MVFKNALFVVMFWLFVVGSSFYWNLLDEKRGYEDHAFNMARSYFKQIVLDRAWNASHGGVYVPVTEKTQPNPFLKGPFRDLETDLGIKLTKINPAFMTRQISEIAEHEDGVKFHITSLNPIRPLNKATEWERPWLELFEQGVKEKGEFADDGSGLVFRYMAPLQTTAGCLPCHAEQGYKEGDIRGGISVTLPSYEKKSYLPLIMGYAIAAISGLAVILVSAVLLENKRKELIEINLSLSEEIEIRKVAENEQGKLIANLQEAISEIKTLQGILPICSFCKKIRDDQGAWNQVEKYIHEHSDVAFSHGVCPECVKKHYPELDL